MGCVDRREKPWRKRHRCSALRPGCPRLKEHPETNVASKVSKSNTEHTASSQGSAFMKGTTSRRHRCPIQRIGPRVSPSTRKRAWREGHGVASMKETGPTSVTIASIRKLSPGLPRNTLEGRRIRKQRYGKPLQGGTATVGRRAAPVTEEGDTGCRWAHHHERPPSTLGTTTGKIWAGEAQIHCQ